VSTPARIVFCTVPSEAVAEQIARTLLDERLVACVNIVPGIRSLYRWNDQVEDDRELLLVIKTQVDRYDALEARLTQLHPYEVCEVVALEVAAAAPAYLRWLLAESAGRAPSSEG
jgi:periplasmic divalent cation tolerance protein